VAPHVDFGAAHEDQDAVAMAAACRRLRVIPRVLPGDNQVYRLLATDERPTRPKEHADSMSIGLGPSTLNEGDTAYILLGCSIPVVLRRVDDHYIYLDSAYVDGYVTGEVIDELEQGVRSTFKDFELH